MKTVQGKCLNCINQRFPREVARATANVTHNHPEGIKGAEATASAIFLARDGAPKEYIKDYISSEFGYDLDRTLDEIRPNYHMDETCQKTVPEAIIAFLEAKDFEDAIRNVVSLGGDTDTLAAITGSIAEAFFGIPAVLIAECRARIDEGLMTDVVDEFDHVLGRGTGEDAWDKGMEGNQLLEGSIARLYEKYNKERMGEFMQILTFRMLQGGEFVIPYTSNVPFMNEEDVSKLQIGDTYTLDHEVRLRPETVTDQDGKEWVGVFTSAEEMHKGSSGNVQMNQPILDIVKMILSWDKVEGMVINPFGTFIQLRKEFLEAVLQAYEENIKENATDEQNN